jgi:predicted dehydrogenase
MEHGADAIVEKPMAIREEYCQEIVDAQKRTGKKAIITFNMRYMPYVAAVKKCILEGAVGKVLSVNMEWMLDTSHGADYFRRWHRYLNKSGGLLIHKASHHFDAVNWWIGQDPVSVQATASRTFYGPTREQRSERCLTCPYKESCSFYFDITKNPIYKELYLDAEKYDGYFRDRCVFDESIDIYDNMALNVEYNGGAVMSYLLIAHSPYEAWKCSITGTDGRLEACDIMSGPDASETYQIILYDRKGGKKVIDVEKIDDVHGGGDARIRRMLFLPGQPDPLGQQAGTHAGAMSALIGAAANRSIVEGVRIPINIRE